MEFKGWREVGGGRAGLVGAGAASARQSGGRGAASAVDWIQGGVGRRRKKIRSLEREAEFI
jgi:hypothetical protein